MLLMPNLCSECRNIDLDDKQSFASIIAKERNEIEAQDWVNRQRLAPKKVLFLRERAREREGDEKESWV